MMKHSMDPRVQKLALRVPTAENVEFREVPGQEKPDLWGETLDDLYTHTGVRVSSTSPEKSKKMIRNARRRFQQGRITREQMMEIEDRAELVAIKEMGAAAVQNGFLSKLVKPQIP